MSFLNKRDAIYALHGEKLLSILAGLLAFLIFVGAPLASLGGVTFHLIGAVVILAMIGVAIILCGNLLVLLPMVAAFFMVAAAVMLRRLEPSAMDVYLSSAAWLALSATWTWIVARSVFAPGRVTLHRVVGAVFLYLLVAMAFASVYTIIGAQNPLAFSGLRVSDTTDNAAHLIYFSMVTLTTVGYGDIVPVSAFARSFANLEATFGALYPATLIARLVSLEIEGRSN
ncbi:MAG: potassium channel family protein [Beijerinckiaceae bacterium]|nr:potassium channel family protein [Beijerinckiaceae bacterium]